MNIISVNGQVKTGECVYTGSGKLEAQGVKYIIHAVGPEYNTEKSTLFNSGQLYNTVYNTLQMANRLGCTKISIPAISSGIFGFPKTLCAQVFFCAIKDFVVANNENTINGHRFLKKVRLTNLDSETTDIFKEEFEIFC